MDLQRKTTNIGIAAFLLVLTLSLLPSAASDTRPEPSPALKGFLDAVVPFVTHDPSPESIRRFEDSVALAHETILLNHFYEPDELVLIEGASLAIEARVSYSDSSSADLLTQIAINGMVGKLDADSSFFSSESSREHQVARARRPTTIGADLTKEGDYPELETLRYDSPAFLAELRPGDLITHIDGEDILGIELDQVVERLRFAEGIPPKITVRRDGMPPFDVTVRRDLIQQMPVRYRVFGDVAYVRIGRLDERFIRLLPIAIGLFRADAGEQVKSVVLDLRQASGGGIDAAVTLLDLFIAGGQVARVLYRNSERDVAHRATPEALFEDQRLAVLVDNGTSGVAELVAGVLQDNRSAVLLGAVSAGRGYATEDFNLGDGQSLILSVAQFELPSGRRLDGNGVMPEIMIDSEPNAVVEGYGEFAREQCRIGNDEAGDDAVFGCALAFVRSGDVGRFYAQMRF